MDTLVYRNLFLEKLNALIAAKREDNCFYFTQAKYSKIVSEVVSAKIKCKTPLDYRRLKRFDVLKINDEEKLIVPSKPGETNIQYYVTNEELFSILHVTHTRIGHGGRTRMLKELQVKYKNITYEVVMLYLSLCKQCQIKHSASKKGVVVKPMVSSELNSRCQVDLIDLQSDVDGEYKFIMVYQDHLTKFVQLRPLKTGRAKEVARHVLSIFLTFGAPAILQSDNGREFSDQVISEICTMWKDVKIVLGKSHHSQTQSSVEKDNQDIQNMLSAWMNDNNTHKWSDGLPFVQFAKNTAYHEGIRQSPYEAMFGVKAKRGIASSFLPSEKITNIEIEEQLEEVAFEKERTCETKEQLEETVNTYEKNLGGGHNENHIPKENIEDLQFTSSQQALTEKHELISSKRAASKENLILQAKKMLRTSQKQFPPAQIDDTVRIQASDVDHGHTDSRNVSAVVGIEDSDFYELANKNNTLKQLYTRNKFVICRKKLLSLDKISFQEMSLRAETAANFKSGGQGYSRCHCKRKCSTSKCSCKSKGLVCNSKCHNSLSCCGK